MQAIKLVAPGRLSLADDFGIGIAVASDSEGFTRWLDLDLSGRGRPYVTDWCCVSEADVSGLATEVC